MTCRLEGVVVQNVRSAARGTTSFMANTVIQLSKSSSCKQKLIRCFMGRFKEKNLISPVSLNSV